MRKLVRPNASGRNVVSIRSPKWPGERYEIFSSAIRIPKLVRQGSPCGQIQYLASLFHPDTPNDVAPSAYNLEPLPPELPGSPLEPALTATGFRWAS